MSEPQRIDPKHLRPGPIRHETLPPELLEKIRPVFEVIGPYVRMPLEEFEIAFNARPGKRGRCVVQHHGGVAGLPGEVPGDEMLPCDEEPELVGALIVIFTSTEDLSNLNVPVEVGRRLLAIPC
jgi:hypothetical protein